MKQLNFAIEKATYSMSSWKAARECESHGPSLAEIKLSSEQSHAHELGSDIEAVWWPSKDGPAQRLSSRHRCYACEQEIHKACNWSIFVSLSAPMGGASQFHEALNVI